MVEVIFNACKAPLARTHKELFPIKLGSAFSFHRHTPFISWVATRCLLARHELIIFQSLSGHEHLKRQKARPSQPTDEIESHVPHDLLGLTLKFDSRMSSQCSSSDFVPMRLPPARKNNTSRSRPTPTGGFEATKLIEFTHFSRWKLEIS